MNEFIVADTPVKVRVFQLIAAKHAIGLEAKGLRHSRLGRNGLKRAWARHFSMPPRSSHAEVIARIQVAIDDLSAQMELPL